MYTEESQAVEVERYAHLQYTIFNNQLRLTAMGCRMPHLVVRSSRGSGWGFVVVAVLVCFWFLFLFLSVWPSASSGRTACCWLRGHGRWSSPSPCAKAGHYACGHPRCQPMSTVMPFELLLYHKLIFAFVGFAVYSDCQTRSLFLCILGSVSVINDTNRQRTGLFLKVSSVCSSCSFRFVEEKRRKISRSRLTISPTNRRNFLCISLRTS